MARSYDKAIYGNAIYGSVIYGTAMSTGTRDQDMGREQDWDRDRDRNQKGKTADNSMNILTNEFKNYLFCHGRNKAG